MSDGELSKPWRRHGRMVSARARGAFGNYLGVLAVLTIMVVYFVMTQPQFLTSDNMLTILETNAVILVVSVGLTFTLLVGGFDLSIGGVLALSGVLLGTLIQAGWPLLPAMLVCLVGGLLVGALLNGFPIARLGINFFVMTLGLSFVARGTGLVITEGSSIGLYDSAPALREIGGGNLGDVPVPVIIALGIFGVALLVLRYTGFGRMVYAVGGNTEAARLAGINVVAIRMAAYGICAALAAWAGMMEAGRQASAAPEAATGIEFTAAAAVLLGGTSFVGGYGGVFGTFLGVAFLGVLQNGLLLSGTSVYWQNVLTGTVLILAVLIDWWRRRH